ncbi:protein involved in gliding motility GldI [Nonlabens sp. Hel1_33_55]|uniref:gliding motility-associated peptidyl-prolyl isomerase GldI n=1 Tax=Nonlabens sp. Hel1_33_55 TaxID=1336802 RepID=UPI000875DAC2|nr:gliding motility-associated peptidyl-prolyl isomerase GldI [Nonlabens sp. Hel1_33_55]SCY03371.1 protein involved in gliding motility GldI [Nonlabens sp. Hel1_33_55]
MIALFVSVMVGCKNLEPREPIERKTSTTTDFSIELNKQRNAAEEAYIEKLIEADSAEFSRSPNGFYYRFIVQDSIAGDRPEFGDRVTFNYNMETLDGETIYSEEELSPVTKSLEQEYGIFKGLREGLKLMQVNDEVIFYFPSYTAYGFYGDEKRIGLHTPIKSTVKLLKIDKSK